MDVDATYICIGVAAGMVFNPEDDQSSVELCGFAKANGVAKTLENYSEYSGKYVQLIEELYSMFKDGKQLKEVINYCDQIGNMEIRV